MRKEILLLKGTAAIPRGEADPTADGSGNGTSLPGAGFNAFFFRFDARNIEQAAGTITPWGADVGAAGRRGGIKVTATELMTVPQRNQNCTPQCQSVMLCMRKFLLNTKLTTSRLISESSAGKAMVLWRV